MCEMPEVWISDQGSVWHATGHVSAGLGRHGFVLLADEKHGFGLHLRQVLQEVGKGPLSHHCQCCVYMGSFGYELLVAVELVLAEI